MNAPAARRHKVVGLAFLLGTVLYLDRAALSVAAPAMRRELNLDPMALGWIFSAFVWGYALFHVPSGWLGDRFGARRVLSIIVVLWSAFTAATAAAWSLASLLVVRFLFGAAESGATPNVSQAFSRWIPLEERARAQGIFFAGMSAGASLAPPLVTALMLAWGWRAAFALLGLVGVAWSTVWYLWYRDRPPEDDPAAAESPAAVAATIEWRRLLRNRNLQAILLMYFTYGYTGYIYITWFPTYLTEARNLSPAVAGLLASTPAVLGLCAKPLGGWWSDRLTGARGVVIGRRVVGMVGFGIGAAAVLPGVLVPSAYLSALLLAVADAGAALAHGVCFAVCLDVGMKRAGTLSALMLTLGSLGNACSALSFGAFLHFTGSWIPPFFIAMLANLAGALLWLRINPKEQLV
jgi:MFS family permease